MEDPNAFETIFEVARDAGVYVINGFLVIVYALLAQWALVLSLGCAFGVLLLDRVVALQTAPGGRAGGPVSKRGARITLAVLVLWIIVALAVPMPVPALGLAMWLVTVVAAWLVPTRRGGTLWRGKMALLMYAGANIGLILFMGLISDLSSSEWAALLGSQGNADAAIAQSRGLMQTVATIAIWYMLPLGYIGWVLKEFAINQGSLVAPGKTTAEILHGLRTRGGMVE